MTLLGIPGDNTYSNYQEATRSFWRQTVLPLVARTAKAVSAWLAPAYGGGLELKPDLDQVEALAPEREALWARIERVSFLTLNEKRQAVGYAPVEEPALPSAPEKDETVVLRKYRPDQARAPRGQSDGGQWVDEGGGGGARAGVLGSGSIASGVRAPARDDGAREEYIRVAQADEAPRYRIDLLEHEGRNGAHTIKEHVGKDDAYLLARTRGERGPVLVRKRVGSFPSLEAANKLVSATLASHEREKGQALSNRERVELVARGEIRRRFYHVGI